MPSERRILRLQQLILEVAAQTLQREARDPRIGLVSITRVKLAPDLSTATLGWSVMGDDAERRTCERGLEHATPLVQRAVAKALQTRVTPTISFRFDESLERAQALEGIFQQLREEREEIAEKNEAPAASEDDAAE